MTSSIQFELFAAGTVPAATATLPSRDPGLFAPESIISALIPPVQATRDPRRRATVTRRWRACVGIGADHPWLTLPDGHPALPSSAFFSRDRAEIYPVHRARLPEAAAWLVMLAETRRIAERQLRTMKGAAMASLAPRAEDVEALLQSPSVALWDPLESTCRHASLSIL